MFCNNHEDTYVVLQACVFQDIIREGTSLDRLYFPEEFRRNSVYSGTFLSYPSELRYSIPLENGKRTKRAAKGMCLYQCYS